MSEEELKAAVLKYAVLNAYRHEGKAQTNSVLGSLMAEFPELRSKAKELISIVAEVVRDVNSWSFNRQESMLQELWPELLEHKPVEARKLPPLLNVERFKEIRTRFAPNPDGPLHLGSARPIILCDEYARMYDGKFILRYEDTSPDVKKPILEMYEWIVEDLRWLGSEPDEIYFQSERLPIYYRYAEKLLTLGAAYVCTCMSSHFRELYRAEKSCPCRDLPPEVHLDRWKKMLDETYARGEAVVRIKTDLHHPNPAVREWPALRISTKPHPRMGRRYRVWPLYNFSCAIDDHDMNISHIIRGKEHEVNTTRQRYIFEYLDWDFPEIINVGRLGLEAGILSKSKIRKGVEEGTFTGWDDPRVGTLRALKRRGIQPETIRSIIIDVGSKPVNATLSWGNISAANRRVIESNANRYFFVADPKLLSVSGVKHIHEAKLQLHPDYPDRGTRNIIVEPESGQAFLVVSSSDAAEMKQGQILRLMGLFNIEIMKVEEGSVHGTYHSNKYQEARTLNAMFIHWLPYQAGIDAQAVMPDATVVEGLAEPACLDLENGAMIQFERFGFVRVDSKDPFVVYYSHR